MAQRNGSDPPPVVLGIPGETAAAQLLAWVRAANSMRDEPEPVWTTARRLLIQEAMRSCDGIIVDAARVLRCDRAAIHYALHGRRGEHRHAPPIAAGTPAKPRAEMRRIAQQRAADTRWRRRHGVE